MYTQTHLCINLYENNPTQMSVDGLNQISEKLPIHGQNMHFGKDFSQCEKCTLKVDTYI